MGRTGDLHLTDAPREVGLPRGRAVAGVTGRSRRTSLCDVVALARGAIVDAANRVSVNFHPLPGGALRPRGPAWGRPNTAAGAAGRSTPTP